MFQQLPGRVFRTFRRLAAQLSRKTFDDFLEIRMSVAALEQLDQMFA